jgi:hypothetical protein
MEEGKSKSQPSSTYPRNEGAQVEDVKDVNAEQGLQKTSQ